MSGQPPLGKCSREKSIGAVYPILMGSSKKNKHRKPLSMLGVQPSIPTGKAPAVRTTIDEPKATPQHAAATVAAAAAGGKVQEASTTEVGETVTAIRKEHIEALPTMGDVTGLVAVQTGASLLLVPRRDGTAAECYYDEAAAPDAIGAKTEKAKEVIATMIAKAAKGFDLEAASVGGLVDLVAQRDGSFKNGRNGQYRVRVLEDFLTAVEAVLNDAFVVTRMTGTEWTHEVVISDTFYPGAVIEQIAAQNGGLAAACRRDFAVGKNVRVYSICISSAAQEGIIVKRGHLVQLGKEGKYGKAQMRPVERKITFETIYLYGLSGRGSSERLLKQPFADALAVSSDLVRVGLAQGVRPGVGAVATLRFPYSVANFDAAAKLMDQGWFKLSHPTIATLKFEIAVAISPLELQKMVGIRLMVEDEGDSDSDEEEEAALDLRITER